MEEIVTSIEGYDIDRLLNLWEFFKQRVFNSLAEVSPAMFLIIFSGSTIGFPSTRERRLQIVLGQLCTE